MKTTKTTKKAETAKTTKTTDGNYSMFGTAGNGKSVLICEVSWS